MCGAGIIILISVVTCCAQTDEEFRNHLQLKAAFTKDDLADLDRGRRVVKSLGTEDKREIAVCGVVHVSEAPQTIIKIFQQTLAHKNRKSLIASGRFGERPSLADVERLTLESRDIEDLKKCAVGKCELKLSAAMIRRFQTEVEWDKPHYSQQATELFRKILIDYVTEYLNQGNTALIKYADQDNEVNVADEQSSLLQSLVYLNDFAPELSKYLKEFPVFGRTDVESRISWTKIKFGLKPVVVVTHNVTYAPPSDPTRVLIVSKQIYANHYFDSSLSLTLAVTSQTNKTVPTSYLLYANHSRADALDGSFSRLKRNLARTEAIDNLTSLLEQSKLNIEVNEANESQQGSSKPKLTTIIFGGKRLLGWLIGFITLACLVTFLVSLKFMRSRIRDTHSRSG